MKLCSLKGFPGEGDVAGATGTCAQRRGICGLADTHAHTRTHTQFAGAGWGFSAMVLGEASPHTFLFQAPALMVPSGFELFSGWG